MYVGWVFAPSALALLAGFLGAFALSPGRLRLAVRVLFGAQLLALTAYGSMGGPDQGPAPGPASDAVAPLALLVLPTLLTFIFLIALVGARGRRQRATILALRGRVRWEGDLDESRRGRRS